MSGATQPEIWTGELKRGDGPDKIVGHLVDTWGWKLRIEGTRQMGGGYAITAFLDGEVPKTLRQPVIDGE
jgi:hypothetical protein